MSLTSIMDYRDNEFKHFRKTLSELFALPKFDVIETVDTINPRTKNYWLVGTAFDYLLRFSLEKRFIQNVYGRKWVAENSLDYFKGRGVYIPTGHKIPSEYTNVKEWIDSRKSRNNMVLNKFDDCKKIYSKFIAGELRGSKQILEACLFLAKLDSIVRVGPDIIERINFESEDPSDVADMANLLRNCNLDLFAPKKKIILNPTFGRASMLVGGGDGDIIVDGCLIDIKVKKELKLHRPEYNQLLGYYMLYLLSGIDGHKSTKIERIGIYFARHNMLWTRAINEVDPNDSLRNTALQLEKQLSGKKRR